MTGTVEPAQIFLIGLTLEQFCEPQPTPPGSPTADDLDCDQIITEGELEAEIGLPMDLTEKSAQPAEGIEPAEGLKWTSCTYTLSSGHHVTLDFGYYPDAGVVLSEYQQMRAGAEFDPVEVVGVGDAAYEIATRADRLSCRGRRLVLLLDVRPHRGRIHISPGGSGSTRIQSGGMNAAI